MSLCCVPETPPGVGTHTLGRIIRRILVIIGAAFAAWLLGSLFSSQSASAGTPNTPGLVGSAPLVGAASSVVSAPQMLLAASTQTRQTRTTAVTAAPVAGGSRTPVAAAVAPTAIAPVAVVTHTVAPVAKALTTPLTTALAPVLMPVATTVAPVVSPVLNLVGASLSGSPLGGDVPPPPAPILGPPAASAMSGLLPVAPTLAEPSDAVAAALAVDASDAVERATVASPAGSVPGSNVPSGPARPGGPGGPAGSGGSTGTGGRAFDAAAVPQADGSLLAIRLPVDDRAGVARIVADDPTFSPD